MVQSQHKQQSCIASMLTGTHAVVTWVLGCLDFDPAGLLLGGHTALLVSIGVLSPQAWC